MKFSILVANYNNGKYFQECYSSIIAQTYADWEVIILDDCSTDNSVKIIKEIIGEDKRFKIYYNDVNSGVGITKSKLIELATGEICGFLDPDDALSPKAIESSIYIFGKHKNAVLTYSNFYNCDAHLQPISVPKSTKQVLKRDPYFFNCPIVIVHFVCFRKDVYNQTEKMNPYFKISEDQDLYLKMYEKGDVYFLDAPNYYYRKHTGGISQNDNKKKSYDYWGEVIWNAMKRRNLKSINGKKIPEKYTNSEEIFRLLDYQNSISFRIQKKIKSILQQIFS